MKNKKCKISHLVTGLVFATALACAEARAANVRDGASEKTDEVALTVTSADAPSVVKAMPPDGRRDVQIHFYIDGHRRTKDVNMRCGTTPAYVYAINALRRVLNDRGNPIDAGLRQRGIGKNVEVNTGTAYLLKPEGVMSFSLAKVASESSFGKFGDETGTWDREELVRQVLANEKRSENIVVCVISNDPSLSTRHGVFRLEERPGIMFFMLHTPRDAANGDLFHSNWTTDEWAKFLRESMGVNANDIANAVVDSYYSLSAEEEDGLKALVCAPVDAAISVKKVRGLPQKKMWQTTLVHNGAAVALDEDAVTLAPKSGQNKIVAQVTSPTGVTYTRTWEQDAFFYRTLKDDGQKFDQVSSALAEAQKVGLVNEAVSEIAAAVKTAGQPLLQSRLENLVALSKGVAAAAARLGEFRKLLEQTQVLEKTIVSLKEIATSDEVGGIAKKVRGILETLKKGGDDVDLAAIQKEIDGVNVRIDELEKKIAERNLEDGRKLLLKKLAAKKAQVKQDKRECLNEGELDGFADRAKTAAAIPEIKGIGEAVDGWMPKFKVARPSEPVDPLAAPRVELEKVIQGKLDDPENSDEKIANRSELQDFAAQVKSVKTETDLDDLKAKVEAWEPVPFDDEGEGEGGGGFLGILFVLILLGGAAFAVKKLFLDGKPVATVSFQKAGSTDTPATAEAKLGKTLRFDEALDCAIDVRVTPKRGDGGGIEFEGVSPNKNVWLLRLGGSKKKLVGDTPTVIEAGDYQVFDSEIAMQPIGTATFELLENA